MSSFRGLSIFGLAEESAGQATFLAAILLSVFALGCGPSKPDYKLFPATGTVTIDGKPVADLLIEYHSANGIVAHGKTDETGSYEMTLPKFDKGIPTGLYTVKVRGAGVPMVYDEIGAMMVEISDLQANSPAAVKLKSKATAKDLKLENEAAE
jgi:hypothetical protein